MNTFRIALSGDFVKPDGSPAYPSFDLSPLEKAPNVEYTYLPENPIVQAKAIEGFDALILLSSRFERASFPGDGNLSIIARFGVGFDTVDVPACTDNHVALVTTPDGVRRPVAVAIITMMLALSGKLMQKDRITRGGPEGWAKRGNYMGAGLVGKTLGSLGIGNIGAEMFRLAKPFDMTHIAYDPFADPDIAKSLGVDLVELDEVFERSDVLSISCPLNEDTKGIVSADKLSRMKPTAYLINTARGPIVDQKALTDALAQGRIAGAGLDVFEQEPTSDNEPLAKLDNVILTPHALCWTDQCFGGIGAADVNAVLDVVGGQVPVGIVNREITEDKIWQGKLKGYRENFGDV
jgi:phosphoglycerate dehydrogenase-like enzyme